MARPYVPELLDVGGQPTGEVERSLADLRRFNRWLGGRQVLLKLLQREVQRFGLRNFSMLDVGAASGDLARAVLEEFPGSRVVACDLKPQHMMAALKARQKAKGKGQKAKIADRLTPGIFLSAAVAGDAAALPFRKGSFDFVAASLLLHQFRDEEVVRVLRGFAGVARCAVLVSDLERHWLPLWFLRLTRPVFARSYITQHDAPASVRQAFRPQELTALARAAGLSIFLVERHLPWFRLSLVARHHA